jgi:DNA polymerase-3 subunit epsilon
LTPRGRHRALADADLIWQFWQKIHQRYSPELVDAAVQSLVRRASLPAGLDEDALEAIPSMPGVYIFYGDNDQPLYVGKSVDLRQRVSAHFSSDHRIAKELRLSREIRRVDCRQTAGETGALLLEAQLIKALAPTHNRLLRRRGTPCSWHFPEGASVPQLTSPHDRDFGRTDGLYGIFDSHAKAESRMRKLAESERLCLACLGIEKRSHGTPCFGYQTKRCDGACVGRESLAAHARRVRAALAPLSIDRWPHEGAIAFAERHRTGLTQWHVVDNWCYLGSSEDPRALHGIAAAASTPMLDRDTYTILRRAFKDPTLDVLPLRVERTLSLSAQIASGTLADTAADGKVAAATHAPRTVDASAPRRRPLARKAAPVGQLALDFTIVG